MRGSSAANMLKIIRFHIVAGGFLAFSLGALLAVVGGGHLDLTWFILGYLVVFLGDLSTHYSNDYFDVEVDKYVEQKKFFSGSTILVSNPHLRHLSRSISVALLASSNLLAVSLLFMGLPIEFFLVIFGASLVGWFYSAPPIRLISRGLGEAAVACVTGFAIPGLGYLAVRGQFDPLFLYFVVPFVMYGFMLSLSLGAPDVDVDRKGGKRSLIVRKGARNVFLLILALTASSTLTFLVYSWLLAPTVLDMWLFALFSIAPLTAAVIGFVSLLQKRSINPLSALNVASLFIFNMLTVAYLLAVVSAA
jgi:1,4-dihydroxy-2-naphthoate octaprenyltransferase